LFFLLIIVQGQADYGGKMLENLRELNSGVSIVGMWFGIFLRTLVLGFIKPFFFYCHLYMFIAPLQNFIQYIGVYILGVYCWWFFAHWVSIFVPNRVLSILILVVWSMMDSSFLGGQFCFAERDFCPGGTGLFVPPFSFLNGLDKASLWMFNILWSNELKQYPAYYGNHSFVNRTNYDRVQVLNTGLAERPLLLSDARTDYAKVTNSPDYDGAIANSVLAMIILIVLHNLMVMLGLFLSLAWVRNAKSNAQRKCFKGPSSLLNCATICGSGSKVASTYKLTAPMDEEVAVSRRERSSGANRTSGTKTAEVREVNITVSAA